MKTAADWMTEEAELCARATERMANGDREGAIVARQLAFAAYLRAEGLDAEAEQVLDPESTPQSLRRAFA